DQDGRASMRRYGIRFGAYHIFMPALLKPAPAELITLLWALKNDGLDKPGYGELIPALAAGRTSVVADVSFERMFYKLAGFRFLGKRAVRIDILERLADLIRPLLQWKPGASPRPEGAYDGRRFMATTSMLSILGATPDDMEEILKGLGYRADSVSAAEAAAFLSAQDPAGAEAQPAGAEAQPAAPETQQDGVEAPAAENASSVSQATADAGGAVQAVAETAAGTEERTTVEPAGEAAEPEAPKPVLLWRPGGRNENQRGGRPQQGDRRHSGRGEERADGERGPRQGTRPNRDNRRSEGKPERPGRSDRNDRQDRGKGPQPARFESKPPRKEKPIDPDSPFAKLAALKDQLKK
ncbi:MAG TPA: helicase, partial [Pseudorhizobium sp.]|nr:helicase [Pseudorhizobium sp.]